MPIYEFECRGCGHHFDRLQKLSDADPTVCPSCHAEQLHHVLSAPAFRLAGSGWYETDFKKDGDQRRNLAGDAGAPPPDSKPAEQGDKAAADSDSKSAASPPSSHGAAATAAGTAEKATPVASAEG